MAVTLVLISKAYTLTYGLVLFCGLYCSLWLILAYYREAEPLLWIATITQPDSKGNLDFILRDIYFRIGHLFPKASLKTYTSNYIHLRLAIQNECVNVMKSFVKIYI